MRAIVTTRFERRGHRLHRAIALFVAILSVACDESPSDTCSAYEERVAGKSDVGLGAEATPSCSSSGAGLTDCGVDEENCCNTLLVEGGTFYRTYANAAGCNPQGQNDVATVTSFRLDKYAATVGRFRQFVNAWNSGWRPGEGAGKHRHLNGGKGLKDTSSAGYETGWVVTNDEEVSLTTEDLTSCSGANLTDDYKLVPYACNTWTEGPDATESLPIVCVNWVEANAFCIWDGGFLPSDAELEYAAAGGDQQRKYPWGPADPGPANRYAIYDCNYPSPSLCTNASKIAPVGTASAGAGRWGQLDLAGNVWQWNFGGNLTDVAECSDCANVHARGIRGGGFSNSASQLVPTYYAGRDPEQRGYDIGFRCARAP